MKFGKLVSFYKFLSIMAMNTLLFIIVIDLVLAGFFAIRTRLTDKKNQTFVDPITAKYGDKPLDKVYPGFSKDELRILLSEWARPSQYEAHTTYKESPVNSKYLNVDSLGFRWNRVRHRMPPDSTKLTIFMFGGSTTFGKGMPDSQTIGSYLEDVLNDEYHIPAQVYNWGRPSYYSTQERILLSELLIRGYRPDVALFLDGMNDFYLVRDYPNDVPMGYDRLLKLVDGKPSKESFIRLFTDFALAKAVRPLVKRFKSLKHAIVETDLHVLPKLSQYDDPDRLKWGIDRYFENKAMITATCRSFGIQPVFAWQPVPAYKYDLKKYHAFYSPDTLSWLNDHCYGFYGYPMMADYVAKNPQGDNFIWTANLSDGVTEPLYCDAIHYTGAFAHTIAETLAAKMAKNDLLKKRE